VIGWYQWEELRYKWPDINIWQIEIVGGWAGPRDIPYILDVVRFIAFEWRNEQERDLGGWSYRRSF
jgi:hypothetical protein